MGKNFEFFLPPWALSEALQRGSFALNNGLFFYIRSPPAGFLVLNIFNIAFYVGLRFFST